MFWVCTVTCEIFPRKMHMGTAHGVGNFSSLVKWFEDRASIGMWSNTANLPLKSSCTKERGVVVTLSHATTKASRTGIFIAGHLADGTACLKYVHSTDAPTFNLPFASILSTFSCSRQNLLFLCCKDWISLKERARSGRWRQDARGSCLLSTSLSFENCQDAAS